MTSSVLRPSSLVKKKKKTWNGKKDGQNLIKSHGGGIPHSDHWSNMYIKSDQNHILE